MKLSESIKPISYLKSHASEIIREIDGSDKTYIITQNGEAKAVLQDVKKYEQMLESIAMLKLLALSNNDLKVGNYKTAEKAFESLRERIDREIYHEK